MKTNKLFNKCLAEVNPGVREEVRRNMEKTRVKKGEMYWWIDSVFEVCSTKEINGYTDDALFRHDNYFTTEEEAKAVANKLRAVLKGADVIEMPSEEEIITKSEEIAEIYIDEAYMAAEDMANFWKSKIMK